MTIRYTVVLTPDIESGGYTVTVPALPGCVTDGETIEQALERAQEAIELYLRDEDPTSLAAATNRPEVIVASVEVMASTP
ncbi:MAG: type II toxin-antitoxin system HicB family antitoxin [Thermomicrobiales bacterium]